MRLWRELSAEQHRAAGAAAGLVLTLLLPWYRSSFPVGDPPRVVRDSLSAFEVFTFVEAGVLVVAAAVLYLLYARAQQRGFHLPGGDGWAVTIAGAWVVFLLVWRLFDKPGVERGSVGVSWGLFVAMAVGGALIAAGQRMRAEHRPEPPNPAEDLDWDQPASRRRRRRDPERRPVDSSAVTQVLRNRPPEWEGEPPEPPERAKPAVPPAGVEGAGGPAADAGPRNGREDAPDAEDDDPARRQTRLWEGPEGPPPAPDAERRGDDERLF